MFVTPDWFEEIRYGRWKPNRFWTKGLIIISWTNSFSIWTQINKIAFHCLMLHVLVCLFFPLSERNKCDLWLFIQSIYAHIELVNSELEYKLHWKNSHTFF
jgi:hypothetical protein